MSEVVPNSEMYDMIKKFGGIHKVLKLYHAESILPLYDVADVVAFYPVIDVLNELGSDNYNHLLNNIPSDLILDYVPIKDVVEYYGKEDLLIEIDNTTPRKDFSALVCSHLSVDDVKRDMNIVDHITPEEYLDGIHQHKKSKEFLNQIHFTYIEDYIINYEKLVEGSLVAPNFYKSAFGRMIQNNCAVEDILQLYDIQILLEYDAMSYIECFQSKDLDTSSKSLTPAATLKYFEYISKILSYLYTDATSRYLFETTTYRATEPPEFKNLEDDLSYTFNTFRTILESYVSIYSELYADIVLKFNVKESERNDVLKSSQFEKYKYHINIPKIDDEMAFFSTLDDLFRSLDLDSDDIHSRHSLTTIQQ